MKNIVEENQEIETFKGLVMFRWTLAEIGISNIVETYKNVDT